MPCDKHQAQPECLSTSCKKYSRYFDLGPGRDGGLAQHLHACTATHARKVANHLWCEREACPNWCTAWAQRSTLSTSLLDALALAGTLPPHWGGSLTHAGTKSHACLQPELPDAQPAASPPCLQSAIAAPTRLLQTG